METKTSTTLIIGAGLSAASDFHLPTMRGFFTQNISENTEINYFLKWFYPNQNPEEYNLEDVLSFLNLSCARIPIWQNNFQSQSNRILFDSLLKYTKMRLEIPVNSICSLHESLFQTLKEQDTIISFNYDLVADRVLLNIEPQQNDRPGLDTRMGKISGLLGRLNIWNDPPPSLLPREQKWGFYLKLHGSLDWLYCETPGCENNVNIFACGVSELSEGQAEGMPCRYCGASLKTFIIPPVATKRLEDRGRMAFLWNIALRQLSSATRIAVIGISFAPSDFELRWLVRQAIELRVQKYYELHVVNPSKHDRQNIIKLFPGIDRSVYEYETVKDYIDNNPVDC
ncbi:MAG: hypothetical protein IPN42_16820 [Methylococcaceae bacterium]|nr:hypothetical protein [Methylococcaceae bacterium]